ncbi:hypothetical protein F5888DRAFT_1840469 [Russula emetica]|nr:hypothetical protein F5888DRAFT_1840469 [Russula emetica]
MPPPPRPHQADTAGQRAPALAETSNRPTPLSNPPTNTTNPAARHPPATSADPPRPGEDDWIQTSRQSKGRKKKGGQGSVAPSATQNQLPGRTKFGTLFLLICYHTTAQKAAVPSSPGRGRPPPLGYLQERGYSVLIKIAFQCMTLITLEQFGRQADTNISLMTAGSLFWGVSDAIQTKRQEVDHEPAYSAVCAPMRGPRTLQLYGATLNLDTWDESSSFGAVWETFRVVTHIRDAFLLDSRAVSTPALCCLERVLTPSSKFGKDLPLWTTATSCFLNIVKVIGPQINVLGPKLSPVRVESTWKQVIDVYPDADSFLPSEQEDEENFDLSLVSDGCYSLPR